MTEQAMVITKPFSEGLPSDSLALTHKICNAPLADQLVVRPFFISLDPSNLMWLKLQKGWMEEVKVGDVMKGQALAIVEQSNATEFAPGDIVRGLIEWSTRSTINADQVERIITRDYRPTDSYLTIFSHVGRAAMIGLTEVANIKPSDTVLISTAAGATGSLACQIARATGCRVIGIAGGKEKCEWLMDELNIHGAIDYKNESISERLAELAPQGIDVYYDNVGGEMLDNLLPILNIGARVAICGQISQYSNADPTTAYRFKNFFQIFMRRLNVQGYVVPDFYSVIERVDQKLEALYNNSSVTHRPEYLHGLEQTRPGLDKLLHGKNSGKLIVKV